MYARFLDENTIEGSPEYIYTEEGYVPATPELLEQEGYYHVVEEDPSTPAQRWYYYVDKYELVEEENYIRNYKVAVKKPRPDYNTEVAARIREFYSNSDVEAIFANNFEDTPTQEHATELQEFLAFRRRVKEEVTAAIEDWERS